MKHLFLLTLLITGTLGQCSTIEQLKTTEEVEAFVRSRDPKINGPEATKFHIKSNDVLSRELECGGIFEDWKIKNWEKADLNNDGTTDLLLIGEWNGPYPMVVLDLGEDVYKFIRLKRNSFEPCELFKPIRIKEKTYLKAYGRQSTRSGLSPDGPRYKTDTLSFFNNTLVKYNPQPKNKAISSIKLNTSACFGMCPEFYLEITPDDQADFNGLQHTPVIGKSSFKLKEGSYKELMDLLNYMDVEHLKSNYAVGWTDDQTGTLTVTFADGHSKTIVDYGMQGTPGLKAVFRKMIAIVQGMNTM